MVSGRTRGHRRRKTFDQVQQLLKSKSDGRDATRTASEALLLGKLYDDKGNRMSPSYSTKNGVRYRFYVSSALLRGRKTDVGSVGRLSAAEIESAVLIAFNPIKAGTKRTMSKTLWSG
jgi:site-specific DNA recombinase